MAEQPPAGAVFTGFGASSLDLAVQFFCKPEDTAKAGTDIGVPGLIFPGDPSMSAISLRMASPDAGRMPPIGSYAIDTEGLTVIDDWISSLSDCN